MNPKFAPPSVPQPATPAEPVEPRSNGIEELVDLFNPMKENF